MQRVQRYESCVITATILYSHFRLNLSIHILKELFTLAIIIKIYVSLSFTCQLIPILKWLVKSPIFVSQPNYLSLAEYLVIYLKYFIVDNILFIFFHYQHSGFIIKDCDGLYISLLRTKFSLEDETKIRSGSSPKIKWHVSFNYVYFVESNSSFVDYFG